MRATQTAWNSLSHLEEATLHPADMDVGWIYPWVGLGWVGLGWIGLGRKFSRFGGLGWVGFIYANGNFL